MNDFQRYLAEEFAEDYQEGRISRREALRLIASVTGSLVVATTILAACAPPANETTPGAAQPTLTTGNQPAESTAVPSDTPAAPTASSAPTETAGQAPTPGEGAASSGGVSGTVSPDDPDVQAESVTFTGQDGAALSGYLARPQSSGPFAVVLVCHENRGLTAHIEDVTRRLAKAGYVALAVDLLSRQGGTAAVGNDQVPGVLGQTPPEQFVQDFQSGYAYLQTLENVQAERVGMTGFCFGGGVTWRVATQMPELRAAVPYYGPHPPLEDVPQIQAAVLAIYGGLDSRINAGIPAIEEAMQANNKIFEKQVYEGADHAFHNDTSSRYNGQAAQDAWSRTLTWFGTYLV